MNIDSMDKDMLVICYSSIWREAIEGDFNDSILNYKITIESGANTTVVVENLSAVALRLANKRLLKKRADTTYVETNRGFDYIIKSYIELDIKTVLAELLILLLKAETGIKYIF